MRNTEYCSTIINNNLKATNWNRKKGCKCQHKHIVDWCGCSPNAFRTKDTSRLTSTLFKALFFGRKFEHAIDSQIISFVEKNLLKKGFSLFEEDEYYFQNNFSFEHEDEAQTSHSIFKHSFYIGFIKRSLNFQVNTCLAYQSIADDSIQLLESNLFFKNNEFYGTSLKYALSVNNSFSLNFETIIRKFENATLLESKSQQIKPSLKGIKVKDRIYFLNIQVAPCFRFVTSTISKKKCSLILNA